MPYRKEVQNEWFAFDNRGKPILPLYLEDCDLHTRLEQINWIDARTDFNQAMGRVLGDLKRDCP
jgi:hypothetical protein